LRRWRVTEPLKLSCLVYGGQQFDVRQRVMALAERSRKGLDGAPPNAKIRQSAASSSPLALRF
jgi:hypothetical protein